MSSSGTMSLGELLEVANQQGLTSNQLAALLEASGSISIKVDIDKLSHFLCGQNQGGTDKSTAGPSSYQAAGVEAAAEETVQEEMRMCSEICASFELSEEWLDTTVRTFQEFDCDDDGKLSSKDVKISLRALGYEPTKKDVSQIMSDADTSGNGFICKPDFIRYMASKYWQDAGDTDRLLAQEAMEKIVDVEVCERITKLQRQIFELYSSGRLDEAKRMCQMVVEAAVQEHDRITAHVIAVVRKEKYMAAKTRWELLAAVESFDPVQQQSVPKGMTDNTLFVNYLIAQAAWVLPKFREFCEDLTTVFNTSSSSELCTIFGLPAVTKMKFSLPLVSEAFKMADSSVVRYKIGPPKSVARAVEKASAPWLQASEYHEPKAQYAVTDTLRVTFELNDPLAAALFVTVLVSLFGKGRNLTRLVNRFADDEVSQPPNINMNVRFCGILAEVQVLLSDFQQIKQTLHKYYELKRATAIESYLAPIFQAEMSCKVALSNEQQVQSALEAKHRLLKKEWEEPASDC